MKRALADRLSRAVVGCYPRGALGTHLDPDYRM
jgi:hypothetical protein